MLKRLRLPAGKTDWRAAGLLIGVFVVVTLLWDTKAVWPLKMLGVFFHEICHGLAAGATGGELLRIELSSRMGGSACHSGGIRFVTASAGYLGSMVCGGLILMAVRHVKRTERISGALGAFLLVITLVYVRNTFGIVYGLITSAALIAAGLKLDKAINVILLSVIGLTSVLYAVLDIKSDIIDRPILHSDAYTLQTITGIPTIIWGILWGGLALVMGTYFLLAVTRVQKS